MTLSFKKNYFLLFIIFLLTEIGIVYFIQTGFIRYTFGDYLVVILLYCFFKIFSDSSPIKIAVGVLLLTFSIEFLQLLKLLELIGLQNNQLLKLVIGSTFHISDLIAYSLGILTLLFIEYKIYSLWIT